MAKQSCPPSFLLTRPEAQALRFADEMRRRFGQGLTIIVSPLLAPQFLLPIIPLRPYQAVIFTSETGVQAFRRLSADPVFAGITVAWCVGDRTARAAQAAGFATQSAKGDVTALEQAILSAKPNGPLLHIRGQDQRGALSDKLNSAGIETVSLVAYTQSPQPLTPEAVALLESDAPVVLPLFSPRTAQIFCSEWSKIRPKARLSVAALSNAVAQTADSLVDAKISIAARPDAQAMLDVIEDLIDAMPYA